MSLPFTAPQIFFVAVIIFIVVGFQRGWRRELVSLVFILLAAFLVRANTSDSVGAFLARLPSVIGYAAAGTTSPQTSAAGSFLGGPGWSLIIFAAMVALGYYVGNKVFPRPATPHERFIGIVPSVIGGAFILGYLSNYFVQNGGKPQVTLAFQSPDPANFIAVIFVIAIAAVVVALIAARAKKTAKK